MSRSPWLLVLFIFVVTAPGSAFAQGRYQVSIPINETTQGILNFRSAQISNGETTPTGKIVLAEPGNIALSFFNLNAVGFDENEAIQVLFDFPPGMDIEPEGPTYLGGGQAKFTLRLPIRASRKIRETVRLKVTTPDGPRMGEFKFALDVEIRDSAPLTGTTGGSRLAPRSAAPAVALPDSAPAAPTIAPAAAPTAKSATKTTSTASPGDQPGGTQPMTVLVSESSQPGDEPELLEVATEETATQLRAQPIAGKPIDYTESQRGREYTYVFSDVSKLRINVDNTDGGLKILKNEKRGESGHLLVVRVERSGVHRIEVMDLAKHTELKSLGINIDSRLLGKMKENRNQLVFSNLTGGVPPYKLIFYRGEDYVATVDSVTPEGISIPKSTLREHYPTGGVFSVRMLDSLNKGEFSFEGQTVTVRSEEDSSAGLLWYVIPAVLAFFAWLFFSRSRRRERKRKTLERVRQDMQRRDQQPAHRVPATTKFEDTEPAISAPPVTPPVAEPIPEVTAPTLISEASSAPEPISEIVSTDEQGTNIPPAAPVVPPQSEPSPKSAMKISRRIPAKPKVELPFGPDVNPDAYYAAPMAAHWDLSMVSEIYLGYEAVEKLDGFLREENVDKIRATAEDRNRLGWERNESVPEIGGMLMGQFQRVEGTHRYRISLEKFVPLEASYQSAVKVEIDTLSLARDLGDAQDENPDLSVVGWFHTHPGHGLFLSRPDLMIHHSHFRKPYHIAMEIDSLSERLDTGFFTYTPSGQMNNTYSLRPDTPWFTWKEIDQHKMP